MWEKEVNRLYQVIGISTKPQVVTGRVINHVADGAGTSRNGGYAEKCQPRPITDFGLGLLRSFTADLPRFGSFFTPLVKPEIIEHMPGECL